MCVTLFGHSKGGVNQHADSCQRITIQALVCYVIMSSDTVPEGSVFFRLFEINKKSVFAAVN